MKKHARIRLLWLCLVAALIAAGTYATYSQVPAFRQVVYSKFGEKIREKPVTELPPVFDNKARGGEFGTTKRIPQEEIKMLDSFEKIEDRNTIRAVFPIDISTSVNPEAKLNYIKRFGGSGSDEDRKNQDNLGYLNRFYIENVPSGSTIIAPVDGFMIYYLAREYDPTKDNSFTLATIQFKSDEGDKYVITIGGHSPEKGWGKNAPRSDSFRSLTDAPALDPVGLSQSRSEVLEQAIPIYKGQPIMKSVMETNMGISLRYLEGNNGDNSKFAKDGEIIREGQKYDVLREPPTNLELFLSPDGEIIQPQRAPTHR